LWFDDKRETAGGVVTIYTYDQLGRRAHNSSVRPTETCFLSDGADEIASTTSPAPSPRAMFDLRSLQI
jgi:hypothetical protein